jgi:hypothetical protein
MGIKGTLFSTEILSLTDPVAFPSIRNVPIEALRTWTDVPPLALLPRVRTLIDAHNIQLARRLGRSLTELGTNDDEANRILRLADYELVFEEARHTYAPAAPSRLTCVYLAQDTATGHNYASLLATVQGRETADNNGPATGRAGGIS